jgi:hypothetical protein
MNLYLLQKGTPVLFGFYTKLNYRGFHQMYIINLLYELLTWQLNLMKDVKPCDFTSSPKIPGANVNSNLWMISLLSL